MVCRWCLTRVVTAHRLQVILAVRNNLLESRTPLLHPGKVDTTPASHPSADLTHHLRLDMVPVSRPLMELIRLLEDRPMRLPQDRPIRLPKDRHTRLLGVRPIPLPEDRLIPPPAGSGYPSAYPPPGGGPSTTTGAQPVSTGKYFHFISKFMLSNNQAPLCIEYSF